MATLTEEQIRTAINAVFTDRIPFNAELGLRIDPTDLDCIHASFDMKPQLVGNFMHGILHGGVTCSVIDVVGGIAVFAAAARRMSGDTDIDQLAQWFSKLATIDIRIDFLRPGVGEQFVAKSQIVRAGKRISVVRMDLYNEHEDHIAAGTGSYTQAAT